MKTSIRYIKFYLVYEKITRNTPTLKIRDIKNLKRNGIIKIGSRVRPGEVVIGRVKEMEQRKVRIYSSLLKKIFRSNPIRDISLKIPPGIKGKVIDVNINKYGLIYKINISVLEKRKIQIGDKLAGRHGNKGIISKILPIEDMPYLQDGTPLDILLNPLGIPSRMNVGQILECLLGLAAQNLKERYRITQFDEMQKNGTSTKIVYRKLYEASIKSNKAWLFNPNHPGKTKIFDGRTGKTFEQPISVGYSYILKLIHMVEDKINSRLTGNYSSIMKQPLKGKSNKGGQRFGEMEVWALEGFGAAYTLQEIITLKSDDLGNRFKVLFSIIKGNKLPYPNTPESFKVLVLELQSLCIEVNIYNKKRKIF